MFMEVYDGPRLCGQYAILALKQCRRYH